jgi:ring-1,2-phenylacetyl-CoA epoxidase subunit PaaD
VAATVADPELPMLSLLDLGVLREVQVSGQDVTAWITPTYSGCPAMATMRADLQAALLRAGYRHVDVRTRLDPPWTSDWITDRGRALLAEHGISAPGPVASRAAGPVPLTLRPRARTLTCPHCGSQDCTLTSEFGSTSCKALYRCRACAETFDHIKEI